MMETAWCTTCGRMSPVVDTHDEGTYDGGTNGAREYGYLVADLECGHEWTSRPVLVGPAPGAPQVDRPTAASIRAGDLVKARREEVE